MESPTNCPIERVAIDGQSDQLSIAIGRGIATSNPSIVTIGRATSRTELMGELANDAFAPHQVAEEKNQSVARLGRLARRLDENGEDQVVNSRLDDLFREVEYLRVEIRSLRSDLGM